MHNWCTFSRSYPTLRTFWSLFRNKKTHFCLLKKVRFLNEACLTAHEASCAATHEAELRFMFRLRNTSCERSECFISPQAMLHLLTISYPINNAVYDAAHRSVDYDRACHGKHFSAHTHYIPFASCIERGRGHSV